MSTIGAATTPTELSNTRNTVTLLHEDFEHLLKITQADSTLSSTTVAQASNTNNGQLPFTSWLIDLGASGHITGNPYMFSTFSIFPKPRKIILADGRSSPTLGQGRIELSSQLFLDDVLFVPSFPTSMVSTNRLCNALNCSVFFTMNVCLFQDVTTHNKIGHGCSKRSLYFLEIKRLVATSAGASASKESAIR